MKKENPQIHKDPEPGQKLYCTEVRAISPIDGLFHSYGGPHVPGISFQDAQNYCEQNGLGYCKVTGILVAEIPCKPDTYDPDFDNMIDYENKDLN